MFIYTRMYIYYVYCMACLNYRKQLESDSRIYKVAKDLNEALEYGYMLMKEGKYERIWVLGGQKVYEVCIIQKSI